MKNFLRWMPRRQNDDGRGERLERQMEVRVKALAEQIFSSADANNRTATVLRLLDRFLNESLVQSELPEFTGEHLSSKLDLIANSHDASAYRDALLDILRPMLELAKKHPDEFGEMRRRNFLAEGEFISVNDLLSYGITNHDLHIHLAPAQHMGLGSVRQQFTNGLRELADIVRKHDEVRVVSATSWIVAANPALVERFGFTIEGPIDDETRRRDFGLEDRSVSRASMSREDFLDRYGA